MKLEKKVHAVNEVQRLAVLNYNHILPQLNEFVGQKIILMSGNKSAKFKNAISFLDLEPKKFGKDYAKVHSYMLQITSYSVWLNVNCSFKNDDVSCFYEEQSIYMGEIKNGILTKVETDKVLEFTTYKVGEIKSLIIEKKQLENELSNVKSKLYKFEGYYS